MTPQLLPELLSEGEVAELMGVSKNTVKKFALSGGLDHYKLCSGGKQMRRYTPQMVKDFLESKLVTTKKNADVVHLNGA